MDASLFSAEYGGDRHIDLIKSDMGSIEMPISTVGLDLAKRVFQVHLVEETTGVISRRTLRRAQVLTFFANLRRSLVAMEACGAAHYWARELMALGHEVRLISAQFVKPFLKGNKTDAADAQAIWEAAQRPGMRFVAVKSVEQQSILGLHRVRQQLVKFRTMRVNQLHGLMAEFGIALSAGWSKMLKETAEHLADDHIVPELLRGALQAQLAGVHDLTKEIESLERRLKSWHRAEDDCRRIAEVPGIGLLTATAAVATVGNAGIFRSGREFAAFLGLVPQQRGTGGKIRLLGISKRGDVYLRTLLIHGARTALSCQLRPGQRPQPWMQGLLSRRPKNVAIVALANKMARTIWAILVHKRRFDPLWRQEPVSVAAE